MTAGKSGKIPPGQIIGDSPNNAEQFQYFLPAVGLPKEGYHPDHLEGGALRKCPVDIFSDEPVCRVGYITDASGEVYQHLEYFAFGEIEERDS